MMMLLLSWKSAQKQAVKPIICHSHRPCLPQAGDLHLGDARITLQLVLAVSRAKGMDLDRMAWSSLAAAIALLAARDGDRLEARARCGFSHRSAAPQIGLFWLRIQDDFRCCKLAAVADSVLMAKVCMLCSKQPSAVVLLASIHRLLQLSACHME
jgi:hypothetical protein